MDFHQPPPVHFKYQYPPPTLQVLTNIAKVLATVPKFYTQVLHLMNKMNLPCPFTENFNVESDIIPEFLPLDREPPKETISEEESEIESEEDVKRAGEDVISIKRKASKTKKIIKKPKLMKTPVQPSKTRPSVKTEDVFETGIIEAPKKIEVKVCS